MRYRVVSLLLRIALAIAIFVPGSLAIYAFGAGYIPNNLPSPWNTVAMIPLTATLLLAIVLVLGFPKVLGFLKSLGEDGTQGRAANSELGNSELGMNNHR